MNRERRKTLMKAVEWLSDGYSTLEEVIVEEEEAFENMPESFQDSERGLKMEDTIYDLKDAYDSIMDIMTTLEDIANGIN